ncbi:MAG: DUF3892 domain-containing protein [Clostridiales bacterium]|jgi:hypothetical protein|nr:DUF3892 domain-containing protein [Clostridiales bacterium]
MNENPVNTHALPMMAMKEIPQPAAGAAHITALVKEEGRVSGYQLSDGRLLSKEEGLQLAKAGGIAGVGISENRGGEYLKSIPDGTESNNLGNLPSLSIT